MAKTSGIAPAQFLAATLFTNFVINEYERIPETWKVYQSDNFTRNVFVYLCANLAVALTVQCDGGRYEAVHVISYLKPLVANVMNVRWRFSDDEVGKEIETAGAFLARLLCSGDLETDRTLSFTWARDWLSRVDIEETNPVSLFRLSQFWKAHYLSLAHALSEIADDNFLDDA